MYGSEMEERLMDRWARVGRNNLPKSQKIERSATTTRKRGEASMTCQNPEHSLNDHRRQPMKGGTSIVYHTGFEAKVLLKLNCLDEHEACGLWIQIVDCYRPNRTSRALIPASLRNQAS